MKYERPLIDKEEESDEVLKETHIKIVVFSNGKRKVARNNRYQELQ